MKCAGYRFAVAWIAQNDGVSDDTALEMTEVANQITVLLIADLFGTTAIHLGKDVVHYRNKHMDYKNTKVK